MRGDSYPTCGVLAKTQQDAHTVKGTEMAYHVHGTDSNGYHRNYVCKYLVDACKFIERYKWEHVTLAAHYRENGKLHIEVIKEL